MNRLALKPIVRGALTYGGIIVGTLVVADVLCIALGFFPPTQKPGDLDLGWRAAPATGHMQLDRCTEFSTGETVQYQRNEDGVRTGLSVKQIRADDGRVKVAVVGDSQTELCVPNAQTHAGVLETELRKLGVPADVLAYGVGRFSPLQDYLAFRTLLRPYRPHILVMNVYTGNDFQDMLRVDDRPHFVAQDSGYRVAEPMWFLYDDPRRPRRDRVLFAFRSLADRFGVRGLYLRVAQLWQLAREQGAGPFTVLSYLLDLKKATDPSIGYPSAFLAQMLNQQLFFHHFPTSREESLRRLRALMELERRENPDMLLVMSPLPSYELTGERPVDEALLRTHRRLPVTYRDAVQQEGALYEHLRQLAAEQGWVFVDNLAALRSYEGATRLFNGFDYHLLPAASSLIGRAQAEAIAAACEKGGRLATPWTRCHVATP